MNNMKVLVYMFNKMSVFVLGTVQDSPNVFEITATSGAAYLHFYSDAAFTLPGFNISYEVEGCDLDCSSRASHGACVTLPSNGGVKQCFCDPDWTGKSNSLHFRNGNRWNQGRVGSKLDNTDFSCGARSRPVTLEMCSTSKYYHVEIVCSPVVVYRILSYEGLSTERLGWSYSRRFHRSLFFLQVMDVVSRLDALALTRVRTVAHAPET